MIQATPLLKGSQSRVKAAPLDVDEDIDAVYLWVDGKDPAFRTQYKQALDNQTSGSRKNSVAPHRFRDNGELRHSLRSVHQFAPWIRRIHILTNGQVPAWLNTSHEKIALVTHDVVFDDKAHLPTFNSNAIEMQLHRIPGLSKRFLYFNDDVFLGQPVSKSDYLTRDGGQFVYVDGVEFPSAHVASSVHDQSYIHTRRVLDQLPEFQRLAVLPAHTPQLYDREVLAEIQAVLSPAVDKTSSHSFRCAEDLVLRIVYSSYLFGLANRHSTHQLRSIRSGSSDYSFVTLTPRPFHDWQTFRYLKRVQPRFFCINDELDEGWPSRLVQKHFARFLQGYFPTPSPFEKDSGPW